MPRIPLAIALALALLLPSTAAFADWPSLVPPPTHTPGGQKDAALIIGVEDYAFVPDVSGAAQNAQDWYAWLVQAHGVPFGSAVLMRDTEATRESMLSGLEDAVSRVQPGGTLWVVFVGHGAPASDGSGGLLLGADVQQTPQSIAARGLPHGELLGALSKGQQARAVVILDTCFSGRVQSGAPLVADVQPLVPVQIDSGVPRGTILMTAGRSDQYAGALPKASRPAFSYLLLGAIQGWADADNDARVTAVEAHRYVRGALAGLIKGRAQTPQLISEAPESVLSEGVTGTGPDLVEMVLGPRPPAPIVSAPARLRQPELKTTDRLEPPLRVVSGLEQHTFSFGLSLGGLAGTDGTLGFHMPMAALEVGFSFWDTWNIRLAMRPSFLNNPSAPQGVEEDSVFRMVAGVGTDIDFGAIRLGLTGYGRFLSGCKTFAGTECVQKYDDLGGQPTIEARILWDFYDTHHEDGPEGGTLYLEFDAEFDAELGFLFGLQLGVNAWVPLI